MHICGAFDQPTAGTAVRVLATDLTRADDRVLATEVLERVGLMRRLTHRPAELSGSDPRR